MGKLLKVRFSRVVDGESTLLYEAVAYATEYSRGGGVYVGEAVIQVVGGFVAAGCVFGPGETLQITVTV